MTRFARAWTAPAIFAVIVASACCSDDAVESQAPTGAPGARVPSIAPAAETEPAPDDGVRIAVVDAGSRALVGAVVHWKFGEDEDFYDHVDVGPDGVAILDTGTVDERTLDVVVTCRGHRSEVLPGVRGSRTVTLKPAAPITILVRLADDAPLPDPPRRLSAWLEWRNADGRDDPRRAEPPSGQGFGADRVLRFEVHDPGTYVVGMQELISAAGAGFDLPRLPPDCDLMRFVVTVPKSPLVVVPEGATSAEIVVNIVGDDRRR